MAVELQGEGVQLTPRSEAGGQGYTSDPPPMMCCCCFCSALRSTFYYLERIRMQDFDQKFSNIFRGCYQRTPVVGGEHPLPCSPRPRHAFWPPIFSRLHRHWLVYYYHHHHPTIIVLFNGLNLSELCQVSFDLPMWVCNFANKTENSWVTWPAVLFSSAWNISFWPPADHVTASLSRTCSPLLATHTYSVRTPSPAQTDKQLRNHIRPFFSFFLYCGQSANEHFRTPALMPGTHCQNICDKPLQSNLSSAF